MYNAVLDFFPKHYTKLREITTGAGQGFVFTYCLLLSCFIVPPWPLCGGIVL